MITVRFLAAALVILAPALGNAQAHFRSNQFHFTWLQPPDWQQLDVMIPPVIVNFAKKGTNGEVSCNASSYSSKHAARQNTAAFVSGYNEQGMRTMLLNSGAEAVTVSPKEMIIIAGRDAVSFVSEYRIQHVRAIEHIRQINVFSTRRDLIYTVTCTMPKQSYKKHEADVWKFISGFHIDP